MFREWLKRIQSADESRKKVWLVLFSVVFLAAVIFVWLSYFNNLVVAVNEGEASDEAPDGFSFGLTMKSGAAAIYNFFADRIEGIFGFFTKSKEYIIEP